MSLTPFSIPQFSGLNLVDDPEEVGARSSIDLLNVDLDDRGRIRSRDGYDNLTASAAASRLDAVASFYKTDGTKHVVVSSILGQFYRAYNAAGATVASEVMGTDLYDTDLTRWGGPTTQQIYVTSATAPLSSGTAVGNLPYRWSGTVWNLAAAGMNVGGATPYPLMLEVQAVDNRFVGAFPYSGYSRLYFSDVNGPENWTVTNFIDLTPGDGERITSLVSWRELIFAFKESKFFVFTGNTVGSTGVPIFNYRPVLVGVGAVARNAAVSTPRGVYFVARRGIYLTNGEEPALISREIDPIFRGGASQYFQGGELNHAAVDKIRMCWHDERLYVAYPSGSSTTNNRLLVYDPEIGTWVLWNIAANSLTSFRVGDIGELVFSYAAGANHLGRVSSAYTTDDGTAIASHYQSGFYEPTPGAKTTTRWTKLWGSGTPTLNIFNEFTTSDPLSRGGVVTLGTAPAIAQGYLLKSYQGELFSHKISSTGAAWSLNRLEHDVQFAFQPS